MGTGLIIFGIYALVVLIWCLSRAANPHYVLISTDQLNNWRVNCKNLIVIDLGCGSTSEPGQEVVPGALSTSCTQLPGLLQWIPPLTTLVICCRERIHGFDGHIEALLLQANITAVYWVVLPVRISIPLTRIRRAELNDCAISTCVEQTGRRSFQPENLFVTLIETASVFDLHGISLAPFRG